MIYNFFNTFVKLLVGTIMQKVQLEKMAKNK